jgi:hypothetical protein
VLVYVCWYTCAGIRVLVYVCWYTCAGIVQGYQGSGKGE